jgi:hypothetical protein
MRVEFTKLKKNKSDQIKMEQQIREENKLKKMVDKYKSTVSRLATERIASEFNIDEPIGVRNIIQNEMNDILPLVGLKKKIDSKKKKILICHTKTDKSFSEVIYSMLLYNNTPSEDIIYTSSNDAKSRIPIRTNVFDYLREFFVNSVSDEKIFVIYVTSEDMAASWFAVTEVGAGWITRKSHEIFNLNNHQPKRPLNIDIEWQNSKKVGNNISIDSIEFDKFIEKIIFICKSLGYKPKTKKENIKELKRFVTIT